MIPLSMLRSLRRLRKEKGFRQEDVAAVLQFRAASSYSRIETGKCQPTVFQVWRLCKLYELGWDELLGPLPKTDGQVGREDES